MHASLWVKLDPDTHLKRFILLHAEELRRELRQKAKEEGVRPAYKTGLYELIRTVYRATVDLDKWTLNRDQVLKAARRNFLLSYRPDWDEGRLRRADEAKWAQEVDETKAFKFREG